MKLRFRIVSWLAMKAAVILSAKWMGDDTEARMLGKILEVSDEAAALAGRPRKVR